VAVTHEPSAFARRNLSILFVTLTAAEVFMPATATAGIVPDGSRIWMTVSVQSNICPVNANHNMFCAVAAGPTVTVSIPRNLARMKSV